MIPWTAAHQASLSFTVSQFVDISPTPPTLPQQALSERIQMHECVEQVDIQFDLLSFNPSLNQILLSKRQELSCAFPQAGSLRNSEMLPFYMMYENCFLCLLH